MFFFFCTVSKRFTPCQDRRCGRTRQYQQTCKILRVFKISTEARNVSAPYPSNGQRAAPLGDKCRKLLDMRASFSLFVILAVLPFVNPHTRGKAVRPCQITADGSISSHTTKRHEILEKNKEKAFKKVKGKRHRKDRIDPNRKKKIIKKKMRNAIKVPREHAQRGGAKTGPPHVAMEHNVQRRTYAPSSPPHHFSPSSNRNKFLRLLYLAPQYRSKKRIRLYYAHAVRDWHRKTKDASQTETCCPVLPFVQSCITTRQPPHTLSAFHFRANAISKLGDNATNFSHNRIIVSRLPTSQQLWFPEQHGARCFSM